MVAHAIVDLVDSLFFHVGAIDSFSVVVRNPADLGGLSDGVAFLMDEADKFQPLLVSYLHILSNHCVRAMDLTYESIFIYLIM